MGIFDKIILFISLTALLGTLTTTYFSPNKNSSMIGFNEMNNLNNLTNINIEGNTAYLYTNNTIQPDYKYTIGNDNLFNDF